MTYASWSVVFGEQPSAAKWNILGTNDAAFNNGTGLPMSTASNNTVATSETTTSTSYTDLATGGPAVTVTVTSNGKLLVGIGCKLSNNTTDAFAKMSFALSSANTLAADDARSFQFQVQGGNHYSVASRVLLVTGLAAGSTIATAKYAVETGGSGAGTGTFLNRSIFAIPM